MTRSAVQVEPRASIKGVFRIFFRFFQYFILYTCDTDSMIANRLPRAWMMDTIPSRSELKVHSFVLKAC